ncbi:transcription factor HES-5-like [Dendropsophus ebraccatus]|uniref:transcription factor HES-5-like n=1 Tax=Dendropsophus ebraccatus TaxID=150705 RepID=UPI003831F2BB
MAPTRADAEYNGQRAKTALRQLRKPAVEKLRRERINSSIRQLRSLLERAGPSHPPSSKLEKADVLEMTVTVLKQRHLLVNATSTSSKRPFQDYGHGYKRCLEETLQYLSYPEKMGPANQQVAQYVTRDGAAGSTTSQGASPPASEQPPKHVLWRPW